jgi:ribosomal protein S18 acetylase RimI-like enzyme
VSAARSTDRFLLRPYAGADRAALRRLCCDAAYGDERLDRIFPDRELFADLMTGYYTDREPGSTLVASWTGLDGAGRGELAGYLCGARDTRRQLRVQAVRVAPAALLRFAARGGLIARATWRLLAANAGHAVPGGGEGKLDLERFPAHLHLALAPAARGKGLGRRLAEAFVERLGEVGVAGVHAVVRAENVKGRRFFERLEFREVGSWPALRLPGEKAARKVVYGREIHG